MGTGNWQSPDLEGERIFVSYFYSYPKSSLNLMA